MLGDLVNLKQISTHTLTWSVTFCEESKEFQKTISTHTLTWSVTKNSQKFLEVREISTHTLTWSVTIEPYVQFSASSHFNSHAHVERDGCIKIFFTPFRHFNSHAHVERDHHHRQCLHYSGISTHTLTWSVTSQANLFITRECYFNSHAHVERDIIVFRYRSS